MASILSNIDKEEANIMHYKGEICENEKNIDIIKEKNVQLSFKSEQSMLLLSKLQKEKSKVEKDMDHKVSISQKEIRSLELKL